MVSASIPGARSAWDPSTGKTTACSKRWGWRRCTATATGLLWPAMSSRPQAWRALLLLLAALAQPGWAIVHAAVHAHLALDHGHARHHEGESAPDGHPSENVQVAALGSHEHEHEHLAGLFVRPTHNAKLASPAALPSATPCAEVLPQRRWQLQRDAPASLARTDAAGPSGPRAPPIV